MSRDCASVTPKLRHQAVGMNRMRMLNPALQVRRLVGKLTRDVAMARDAFEARSQPCRERRQYLEWYGNYRSQDDKGPAPPAAESPPVGTAVGPQATGREHKRE